PVGNPGGDADDARAQRLGAHFAYPSTDEPGSSPQQVMRDRCDRHPGGIGVEYPGRYMRQGPVLQLRMDLLDDRVSAVDLISSDCVETIPVDGGEKRVVPRSEEHTSELQSRFDL